MNKNLRYFFIGILLGAFLVLGVNIFEKGLEESFFGREITQNPKVLAAQINQQILEEKLENLKPIKKWGIEDLEISAKSAISVLVREAKDERFLFEKEIEKKLPIASLTKLITGQVVLENYDLEQVVEISEEAVKEKGDFGEFKIGEIFTVRNLLYSLLMESSNDAAIALAELVGREKFIELMNQTSENLGLQNTYFVNPTGLDPDFPHQAFNYSTSQDLAKLTKYLLQEPLIWEILSKSEFDFYSSDGVFHHKILNTNQFLESNDWKIKIIGGKTGETPRAKGCLLLVVEAPKGQGQIINVVLASEKRFEETRKLINWLNLAYKW